MVGSTRLAAAAVIAVMLVGAFAWSRAIAIVPFEQADLNNDGRINSGDVLWFSILAATGDARADVNRDGRINSGDQLAIGMVYLEVLGIKPKTPTAVAPPTTRDPLRWPFSPSSPWNMPIGANAVYVDAGLPATFMGDEDEIIAMDPGAPLREVVVRNQHDAACNGNAVGGTLPVPDGLLTALTSPQYLPNNTGAFVLPDGRRVREANWAARCEPAGPVYFGLQRGTHSLHGDGISGFVGGHGGSALSALGGSLRHWEIAGNAPIMHALKLTISAQFLSQCNRGYRWPAQGADQGYNEIGSPMEYKGTNCALRMGSLLALGPGEDCEALVTHPFARRICWTLQNYGAYVVDSGPSSWQPHVLNVELGGNNLVRSRYGMGFTQGTLQLQMLTLMTRLKVVDNSAPNAPGGGGTPRQPLAPPLTN